MRETSVYSFRFWYAAEKGFFLARIFGEIARVNREGLFLGEGCVFFQDIYKVSAVGKTLVITLFPFPTVNKVVSKHFLPRHTALVLRLNEDARAAKAVIDRRISALKIGERLEGMSEAEKKRVFKKKNCPCCDAMIDLTYLDDTPYLYCAYCEALFDKHGYLMPGGNEYKICPESGYFDRVDKHRNFQMYYLYKEKKFSLENYVCGDAFARLLYKKNARKNAYFGLAWLANAQDEFRSKARAHPSYKLLAEANLLAMEGKIEDAAALYYKILVYQPHHPGIYLNYALGYLGKDDKETALKYLKKSVDACANYLPTKAILEKYALQTNA